MRKQQIINHLDSEIRGLRRELEETKRELKTLRTSLLAHMNPPKFKVGDEVQVRKRDYAVGDDSHSPGIVIRIEPCFLRSTITHQYEVLIGRLVFTRKEHELVENKKDSK